MSARPEDQGGAVVSITSKIHWIVRAVESRNKRLARRIQRVDATVWLNISARAFGKVFAVSFAGAVVGGIGLGASPDAALIVAAAADFILIPGRGSPPEVESHRLTTRGFNELAAASHFGPVLAADRSQGRSSDCWSICRI